MKTRFSSFVLAALVVAAVLISLVAPAMAAGEPVVATYKVYAKTGAEVTLESDEAWGGTAHVRVWGRGMTLLWEGSFEVETGPGGVKNVLKWGPFSQACGASISVRIPHYYWWGSGNGSGDCSILPTPTPTTPPPTTTPGPTTTPEPGRPTPTPVSSPEPTKEPPIVYVPTDYRGPFTIAVFAPKISGCTPFARLVYPEEQGGGYANIFEVWARVEMKESPEIHAEWVTHSWRNIGEAPDRYGVIVEYDCGGATVVAHWVITRGGADPAAWEYAPKGFVGDWWQFPWPGGPQLDFIVPREYWPAGW